MSSIDWASVDLKNLDNIGKRRLGNKCHEFGKLDNFLLQVVLLTIMVHQLAIIYNAERAIDIASITNKCNGLPATDIIKQCEIAIWASRVGFGFAALMLLITRSVDSWSNKSAAILKTVFGAGMLIPFIISIACSSIAKGKIAKCTATQPPNQVGSPVDELNSVLGFMINWSAIGMTASLLFCIFYVYRAVTGSSVSVTDIADQASDALSSASGEAELQSAASSPTSSTA